MSDVSARLELPFILPAQAQKHVTHNEGLLRLDALVQLVMEEEGASVPPGAPQAGQVWGLSVAPTGDWAGQPGMLAQWLDPGWAFIAPQEGWRGWDRATGELKVFDGSAWAPSGGTQNLDGVGIGTSWDATNRLAVASDASLLSHAGQGHQLKLNKAGISDTASLLYQTNWNGHAEMGLAGNNDFSIKVSPDGTSWTEAVVVDAGAGTLSGAAVQSSATDTGAGKLARADYAYGPGNLVGTVAQAGGVPTGAVIEQGANADGSWLRLADGTQVTWRTKNLGPGNFAGAGTFNDPWSVVAQAVEFPLDFVAPPVVTFSFDVDTTNDMARSVIARYRAVEIDRVAGLRTARFGAAADSTDVIAHCIAFGRWY